MSGWFVRLFFGWLLDCGVDYTLLHQIVRKAAHFTIFLVEGALLCVAALSALRRRSALIATSALCAVVAVLNELFQRMADGRSCQVGDMAIDFCGGLCGMLAALAILHAFSKHKSRQTSDER